MQLMIGANTVLHATKISVNIQIIGHSRDALDFSTYLLSQSTLKVRGDDDMIFYGQTTNLNRSVILSNDNSNKVNMMIDLQKIDADISKIAICATVVDTTQTFSSINKLQINISDHLNSLVSATIEGAGRSEAALILGEVYRHQGHWKFRLVAQGFNGGLKPLAEHFGVEIADEQDLDVTPPFTSPPPIAANANTIMSAIKGFFSAPLRVWEQKKEQELLAREKQHNLQGFESLLIEALSDGELSADEMRKLENFCQHHGLVLIEALERSKNHVNQFLRYTLTSISSEQTISPQHRQLIKNLCDFLKPNAAMTHEIEERLRRITDLEKIKRGDVSPIRPSGFVANNSEIVWFHLRNVQVASLSKEHMRHHGELFVTSERIVFKSAEKPINIPISAVIGLESKPTCLYISAKTKKNSCVLHAKNDADIMEAHVDHAINRFHRRLDLRHSASDNRRIPQSTRNAVWSRCGGQCVDCESTQYLEFDHIIPFSRGGSNSENNLQILCRACNLAKRDRI